MIIFDQIIPSKMNLIPICLKFFTRKGPFFMFFFPRRTLPFPEFVPSDDCSKRDFRNEINRNNRFSFMGTQPGSDIQSAQV